MENIVNIVNFIRGAEPRDRSIDLVEPVREQIRLMKENNLPGTFLVQYDAMLRDDIMELLLPLDPEQFEVGIWLEMNQPHCEAAGLKWRGREGYEWDWHAHCGFSVGYTREEREKLVDVIFAKFEEKFGRKAKSVGSWMIDAYSLGYMADKYGIVASCNCKDQWGTDGYTIWGGYWNQAYYPSRVNVLSPAQTEEKQIPVPVFRMLGSDPVTQYDLGLKVDSGAAACQSVASLEPVYNENTGNQGGGFAPWVDWFMRQNFTGGSLAFAYAQAGQENSFGWPKMKRGLEYQFPLFAQWREKYGLRVERMEDSGRWYKENFEKTPATSVSALEPYGDRQAQSVWYNCKDYRINLYRDAESLRIRDITLFDERYEERYMDAVCETEYLVYDNLSVMDGNRWSGSGVLAGGFVTDAAGKAIAAEEMTVEEKEKGLTVKFGGYAFEIGEDGIALTGGAAISFRWKQDRAVVSTVQGDRLVYEYRGMKYALKAVCGKIACDGEVRFLPENGKICLALERM